MRPKGGKFTHTRRISHGCVGSKACPICFKCCNYSQNSAHCKECYPNKYLQPMHCMCAQRGMDQLANYISQAMDTAMFDPNLRSQGTVSIHNDPASEILDRFGRHLVVDEG